MAWEQWNYLMTDGRTLPWLQDTQGQNVWEGWAVIWRDVVILDTQNNVRGIYNLTEHDLGIPANLAELKKMLLDAAALTDADGDGLADDWETIHFGSLLGHPAEDADADHKDNLSEFAFATNPQDAKSNAASKSRIVIRNGKPVFEATFRQRAGWFVDYVAETSPDMTHWTPKLDEELILTPPKNLFDGTGAMEATYSLPLSAPAQSRQFLRIKAVPRTRP